MIQLARASDTPQQEEVAAKHLHDAIQAVEANPGCSHDDLTSLRSCYASALRGAGQVKDMIAVCKRVAETARANDGLGCEYREALDDLIDALREADGTEKSAVATVSAYMT